MRIRGEKLLNSTGVYVHIPYCIKLCPYCDFNSIYSRHIPEERYAESVIKELALLMKEGPRGSEKRRLTSVYIGGGTPTTFCAEGIGYIIERVKGSFAPAKGLEVTIEANPDTVDLPRLKGYRACGVNRISIGVQSLNDDELKALGRTHSAKKAMESFCLAREAGFKNIGIDLIFGIPGQTVEDWEKTLRGALTLGPEHISLYGLTIEEGTPFYSIYKGNRSRKEALPLPSEDSETEMYGIAVKRLKEAGYRHYEISNFALPGRLSAHNRRYWLGADYIGLGAGAHSYLSSPGWGVRWWNVDDPDEYMRLVESSVKPAAGRETLGKGEAITETLMLGLRMLEKGIIASDFERRFHIPLSRAFGHKCSELEKEGFLQRSGGCLRLTDKGVLLSNEVFLQILP